MASVISKSQTFIVLILPFSGDTESLRGADRQRGVFVGRKVSKVEESKGQKSKGQENRMLCDFRY